MLYPGSADHPLVHLCVGSGACHCDCMRIVTVIGQIMIFHDQSVTSLEQFNQSSLHILHSVPSTSTPWIVTGSTPHLLLSQQNMIHLINRGSVGNGFGYSAGCLGSDHKSSSVQYKPPCNNPPCSLVGGQRRACTCQHAGFAGFA